MKDIEKELEDKTFIGKSEMAKDNEESLDEIRIAITEGMPLKSIFKKMVNEAHIDLIKF